MEIIVSISRDDVMEEVAMLTGYAGANMTSEQDPGAYDRISTTDENVEILGRFWREGRAELKAAMDEYMTDDGDDGPDGDVRLVLDMPGNYNTAAVETLRTAAKTFMVQTVLASWFLLTNKQEAEAYATMAAAALKEANSALYKRRRPFKRSKGVEEVKE